MLDRETRQLINKTIEEYCTLEIERLELMVCPEGQGTGIMLAYDEKDRLEEWPCTFCESDNHAKSPRP